MWSYRNYLEMKTCSTTKHIRRKPGEVPGLYRGKPGELPDICGEENRQSYQTCLEKKTFRDTRPIWGRKPAELPDIFGDKICSYQAYLENTCRATSPIWRGPHWELLDLFGEETLQSYPTYLEDNLELLDLFVEEIMESC